MFWETFVKLCSEHNKKPNPVAKELGFSSGSVTDWKNGKTPRPTTIQKIADYFGVTTEYLLTGKEKAQPQGVELDEVEAYLAEIGIEIRSMDDSDRQELKNYVQYLVSRRKNG